MNDWKPLALLSTFHNGWRFFSLLCIVIGNRKRLISFVNIKNNVFLSFVGSNISWFFLRAAQAFTIALWESIEKMRSKTWCLYAVALTIFLAIMDNAESYISSIPGNDIERKAKHSEGNVQPRVNSDTSTNKQKRIKMRKMQVTRKLSLIKMIFIGPFK